MPVYAYRCEKCRFTRDEVRTMDERDEPSTRPHDDARQDDSVPSECDGVMRRHFGSEQIGATPYAWRP